MKMLKYISDADVTTMTTTVLSPLVTHINISQFLPFQETHTNFSIKNNVITILTPPQSKPD